MKKQTKKALAAEKKVILAQAQAHAEAAQRTSAADDIRATNAEPSEEICESGDILLVKPLPVMEYGTPLLIFVNGYTRHEKPRIIKNGEQTPDGKQITVFYEIRYKILDTEYGTKSREKVFNVFDDQFAALVRACLANNTRAVCAVFEPEPYEVAEKDKDTGEPTGRMLQLVSDKLVSVTPLTPAELAEVRNIFF